MNRFTSKKTDLESDPKYIYNPNVRDIEGKGGLRGNSLPIQSRLETTYRIDLYLQNLAKDIFSQVVSIDEKALEKIIGNDQSFRQFSFDVYLRLHPNNYGNTSLWEAYCAFGSHKELKETHIAEEKLKPDEFEDDKKRMVQELAVIRLMTLIRTKNPHLFDKAFLKSNPHVVEYLELEERCKSEY
jgi:hypothetical protein